MTHRVIHKPPLSQSTTMTSPSPIRGIDHVGLTVPDLAAACRFFERAFDAELLYEVVTPSDPPLTGEEVAHQLGIHPEARIVHMCLLKLGEGPTLELFCVTHAAQREPATLQDFGLQHIALYVDDMARATQRFEEAGGALLSPPHPLANNEDKPGNLGVYGRAPWGMLIELLTYPGGIDYPAEAPDTRWTPPPRSSQE